MAAADQLKLEIKSAGQDPDSGQWAQLFQWLQSVDPSRQEAVTQQILDQYQSRLLGPGGPMSSQETFDSARTLDRNLMPAAPQAAATPQAPATPQASPLQQQQQNLIGEYGASSVPAFGDLQVADTPSAGDWASMSKLMGTDAQKAYADYLQQQATAHMRFLQAQERSDQPAQQPPTPLSQGQWFQKQQTNLQGPWQPIIAAFDAQYQLQTGEQMPLALEGQLMDQIHTMTPAMRNALLASIPQIKSTIDQYSANPGSSTAAEAAAGTLASIGASSTGAAGPGSALYNTFQSYASVVSSSTQQSDKALQQNISTFISQMGRGPSKEEISSITGMDYTSLQRYLDNLPSKIAGMNTGQYNTAYSNTKSLFMDKLGYEPTNDQLRMFAGWSKDDISRWVESQQSTQNPGMTVGQRDSYIGLADDVSKKWWGAPADDRLVQTLGKQFGTGDAPASSKTAVDTLSSGAKTP